MLDIAKPVGNLTAGMVGNSPDDVRIVQYLMNRTSSDDGAPTFFFDTTSGLLPRLWSSPSLPFRSSRV